MLNELGEYKDTLVKILMSSEDVMTILLGKDYQDLDEIDVAFDEHVYTALFVDGVQLNTGTFVYFDTYTSGIGTHIKDLVLEVDIVCSRDILNKYSDIPSSIRKKYTGNRVDKIANCIENVLTENKDNANKFGIGELSLKKVGTINTKDYYGRSLIFASSDFR